LPKDNPGKIIGKNQKKISICVDIYTSLVGAGSPRPYPYGKSDKLFVLSLSINTTVNITNKYDANLIIDGDRYFICCMDYGRGDPAPTIQHFRDKILRIVTY
jgi:hypothetical protein